MCSGTNPKTVLQGTVPLPICCAHCTRAYASLKEGRAKTDSSDAQLKRNLADAGRTLSKALQRATSALAQQDTAAYIDINAAEVTPGGASNYSIIMWMVAVGVAVALCLVLVAYMMLKSVVCGRWRARCCCSTRWRAAT